ncbi:MAG TPA: 2-oxo acid dehydrogenase subunit E2 [Candidatus Dormibacteraeota bacterium]|nr:2-oxo acid dehydrogenase subunit E2 [Candidatus Dormibacteraeota bacterium]
MTAADVHPILVPREIVNADSVFVVRWLVAEGAAVEPGATVCEVETSKAVLNVDAEQRGHLRRRAAEGDEVPIGGVLGYLTAAADTPLPDVLSDAATPAAVAAVQISAKARQKMEELGLDPALFAGRAFVREKDVVDMAAQVHAAAAASHDPRGPFRLEPLGAIQRRVARVMSESVAAIPSSYLERTIDLAPVRAHARALAGDSKAVVTEVDLLVAAVARAAAAHPHFNGFLTDDYSLHLFERVNVGVAVDVEGDLYVIVVHDAAAKEPAAIAKELRGLQFMALRRRLTAAQLSGGTITVTSMLGRGVHRFQPIPYPHQAAIVGLSDTAPDSTQAALVLVFDHRVANGSQAAAFLAAIDAAMRG